MRFIAPTNAGWTSQTFGTRPGGFNPVGGHTGEDIAVPVGTPLVAMAEGVVVHVGYFKGKYSDNPWWIEPSFAGFVVTVDYGDYLSHYAHCSRSPVLSGKRVQQGEVVAYSGNTGSATTGPHLHWEVMPDGWDFNNGTYGRINPRSILGAAAIAPQGTITTEEDEDMAISDDDARKIARFLLDEVVLTEDQKPATLRWFLASERKARGELISTIVDGIFNRKIKVEGEGESGETSFGAEIGWFRNNFRRAQK